MTTNEELRAFADSIDHDELPTEGTYVVEVARAPGSSEESKVPVSEPIDGYYHAQYVRDRLQEAKGYAGVSLYVEEVTNE